MHSLNKFIASEFKVSPLIIRPTNLGQIADYNKSRNNQASINNLLETFHSNSEDYFAVSCKARQVNENVNENPNYVNVAHFDQTQHNKDNFFEKLIGYSNPQFHYMNSNKFAALNNQRALQIFEIRDGVIHETIKSTTEQIVFFKFNPVYANEILLVTEEKIEIWDISHHYSALFGYPISRGREIVTNADWYHDGEYLTICSKSESLVNSASARSPVTANNHIYLFDKKLNKYFQFNCKENEKAIILNCQTSKSVCYKLKFEIFTCRTSSLNGKTSLQAYIRHLRIFTDDPDV